MATKRGICLMRPSYPSDDRFELEGPDPNKTFAVPTDRPVRIYCDGVYDMFHYGHARSLMQAKNLFPNVQLIVGVTSDDLTTRLKGRTVMTENERYESVRHCRYVDEVVEDAPWVITDEFVEKHRIDFVAHDDIPYSHNGKDDIYRSLKEANKFVPTKRTAGISTTGLITRILRDYEIYLRRQILRGISWQELNISAFKEKQVRIKEKIYVELKELKKDIKKLFKRWEETSNEWVRRFIERFGENQESLMGALVGFIGNRKTKVK